MGLMWVGLVMIEMIWMSGAREGRLQGLCPMTPTVSPLHRHLVTLAAPTLHSTHCTAQYIVHCTVYCNLQLVTLNAVHCAVYMC